jgi:hypothetical protein
VLTPKDANSSVGSVTPKDANSRVSTVNSERSSPIPAQGWNNPGNYNPRLLTNAESVRSLQRKNNAFSVT